MPKIILETLIKAPIDICFNLARDIDLHTESTKQTGETAIAGRTSGLIELNETVTWRARHFGIWQTLTTEITAMEAPDFFVDEMIKGAFKGFRHQHYFTFTPDGTLMRDVFDFESPLGFLGRLANQLFLARYMKKLLVIRNDVIKMHAENTLV